MSPITTHVLDTSQGCPGANIRIRLEHQQTDKTWQEIASGSTNSDGRIANSIQEDEMMNSGVYRMLFETGPYFEQQGTAYFIRKLKFVFYSIIRSSIITFHCC